MLTICRALVTALLLAMANIKRKSLKIGLGVPPLLRNPALTLMIPLRALWESSSSRQEKRSCCHGNGASTNPNFRYSITQQLRPRSDTAWPMDFDPLLDHRWHP